MTLTKAQLIEIIQNDLDLSKTRAFELVEALLEIIKVTLENGEDVLLSGFGKFSVQSKNERRGRNPATGDDLMLGPRKVVVFKCSGTLKNKINS